jgi:DNA-binding transcriptional MerR regulator
MRGQLSIREFSKFSGVKSSTLRYWDEIGLFKPVKRDSDTSYRYYAPEQIIAVNFIKVLSSLNVPLKTIQELGQSRAPKEMMALIADREKVLDMELKRLRECYSIMHIRRELISRGKKMADAGKISVLHEQALHFILGERNNFKNGEEFYTPFMHFCEHAKDAQINLRFPVGALHESWSGFMAAPGEPHYFISLDPAGNQTSKAGYYVVGYIRGYYGQFGDLPERMAAHIKNNKLETEGPVYTLYLLDEVCTADCDQYLAMVCVAVKKPPVLLSEH